MAPAGKKPLAPKPTLGWNSYDCYRNDLHEDEALENLEIFARVLAPHGYDTFVIDLGWYSETSTIPGTRRPWRSKPLDFRLNEYGYPVGSNTWFPSGMKRLADRAHELGVKFGLHLMRGMIRKAWEFNLPVKGTPYRMRDIADTDNLCSWCDFTYGVDMAKPGAQEYYDGLMDHMAAMGVDFIKYDDLVPHPAELEAIGRAVAKCDHPMVLSLSPGNATTVANQSAYEWGHLLRISGDVWDCHHDLDKVFRRMREWQGAGKPGFWPDLDMLCVGTLTKGIDPADDMKHREVPTEERNPADLEPVFFRDCRFTRAQERTFMAMRALAASPLFMGGCLKRTPKRVFDLITHPDLLACNQQGTPARLVTESGTLEVWKNQMISDPTRGWVAIFNRSEHQPAEGSMALFSRTLPLEGTSWRDCFGNRAMGSSARFQLGPDEVLFLEYRTH